jgi:hypothetical protein
MDGEGEENRATEMELKLAFALAHVGLPRLWRAANPS